ncbi:MAG: imidazolonepropionase [Actinomycetota bacterium]|nr:imidazolonepropionase [Actinomycetota bacterium]
MEKLIALKNATIADCDNDGRYRILRDSSLIIQDGIIKAIGDATSLAVDEIIDLGGRLVTPGLIDVHTHLIYGGDRSHEFSLRLNGATYEEISRAGGGISSTVISTRQLDDDSLLAQTKERLTSMAASGTTTIEIKSGYGLSFEDERRLLELIQRIKASSPINIFATYLAAHAMPKEFNGTKSDYIDEVVSTRLPELHRRNLFDKVDLFCDSIAFSLQDSLRIIDWCTTNAIPFSVHGEQLTHSGIAKEAALRGALSVDHLEQVTHEDVHSIAKTDTVSVLLPGAYYFLRETVTPPIEQILKAGCKVAIATDHNPGTSPLYSLPLAMNLASTLFRIPTNIALAAVTRWAAQALGYVDRGAIEVGLRADLAIWNLEHPDQLCYRIGSNDLEETFVLGERVHLRG